MKYLIVITINLFLLLGCTQTTKNIEYKYTKQNIVKKKDDKDKKLILDNKNIEDSVFTDIHKYKIQKSNNIAVVFSSLELGKYALEATITVNTYLLYKNQNFNVITYNIDKYKNNKLENIFKEINQNGTTKVMLMITKDRLPKLLSLNNLSEFKIYIPLINSYDANIFLEEKYSNIIFGAISYKKQFEKLLSYSQNNSFSEFYDNSNIGSVLHSYLTNNQINYSRRINDRNGEYKRFLKDKALIGSSILLNTPIVKSSIILSQINAHEINPKEILSSQLNYSPFLFTLTQKPDRRKVIVANSINKLPDSLVEYNNLLNNNIIYNWVNYSTILGTEYLLNNNLNNFEGVEIKNNQVEYLVELYRVRDSSFKKID